MKKTICLLCALFLLASVGCASNHYAKLEEVRGAFERRLSVLDDYYVDEIAQEADYAWFSLAIGINRDEALTEQDYVYMQAHVFEFDKTSDAVAAQERNASSGVGGTCLRSGRFVLLWLDGDPFADLYREVFEGEFGKCD